MPNPENWTTPRQLGRVSDADWLELKVAAAIAGESFTEWALRHLLAAAKREKTARDRKAGRTKPKAIPSAERPTRRPSRATR